MSTTPTLNIIANELHMAVPYALNGAFRAVFKTAKWNPSAKVFIAAATAQNRKKWDQFLATVKDAVEFLANADNVEATAEELECAAREADQAVEKALASLKYFEQRAIIAGERKARAEEQLSEFGPVLEKASAALSRVLSANAAAEEARDAVVAPALHLFEAHGLERILADISKAARAGYRGKEARGRAQEQIVALRDDLGEIGFRLEAIDDLARASLNRPDNIIQYVEAALATMHSGLEVIEQKD